MYYIVHKYNENEKGKNILEAKGGYCKCHFCNKLIKY